jgi:phosphoribosylanthranilate isomerase
VDVNSSLETAPGVKSVARLEEFMRAFDAEMAKA